MANELKHGTVGTELTQAEWEAVGAHVVANQAVGDIIYASSTSQLRRLGVGSTNDVLRITGGVPDWQATSFITSLGTIATGVWQGTDVGVAHGGTGVSTLASNSLLTGNGASAIVAEANLTFDTNLYLNDSANTYMSLGLTLNQGAGDNEIVALKSSDVTHGVTSFAELDTYAAFSKGTALGGGLSITAIEDSDGSGQVLSLTAITDAGSSSDRSNTATGAIRIVGFERDGTSYGNMGANENILVVAMGGATTRFILDSDGDSHQDVGTAWTNFDDHNDIALLRDLSREVTREDDPIRKNFGQLLQYNRSEMEAAKLVQFNDNGHHFVNMSRLTMLHTGAIWQGYTRQQEMQERIEALEGQLLALEGGN